MEKIEKFTLYHSNGNPDYEGSVLEFSRKRQGIQKVWRESGKKYYENIYKDDKMNGICKHFNIFDEAIWFF